MIYLVAFLSGGVLMGLEMVGSRILAPFFGSSVFVWGSLIGVVLLALSLGYYAGGKLSDQYPGRGPLAIICAVSAFFVSISLLIRDQYLHAIASSFPGPAGPVIAAFSLFFAPSVLLAMVSPWCIRVSIGSIEGSGTTSGILYSVSNAGSIVGTFTTTFLLIPTFKVDWIVRGMAITLVFLSGLVLLSLEKEKRRFPALVLATCVLSSAILSPFSGFSLGSGNVIYETQSLYHNIIVVDKGKTRLLKFDNSIQGGMYLERPYESCFPYADYFHLALCFNRHAKDALMIGLGAGLVPKRFWKDYADMTIDVVEIDEKVQKVADRYFQLPRDARFKVYIDDGRLFVKKAQKKYDLIMIDAYYADSIPFHLTTQEFYNEVKSKLKPGGVVAYNMIGAVSGEKSKLFRSMHLTFSKVFPVNYVFPLSYSEDNKESFRNILVFGVNQKTEGKLGDLPLTRDEVLLAAKELAKGRVTLSNFLSMVKDLYDQPINHSDAVILTDQYAPVDSLLYLY